MSGEGAAADEKARTDRGLVLLSLAIAALYPILFWGHRTAGLGLVADVLEALQGVARPIVGETFLIRAASLFPVGLFGLLVGRQIVRARRRDVLCVILLAVNALILAPTVALMIVMGR